MPKNEFGIFYTTDCYVFLCRYYVINEEEEETSDQEDLDGGSENGDAPVEKVYIAPSFLLKIFLN